MHRLEEAVGGLAQVLESPPRLPQPWRHLAAQRVGAVIDALTAERTVAGDPWLAARAGHLEQEQAGLLTRLRVLGAMLADGTDPEGARQGLVRLVADIRRHRQRVCDLAYDAVDLDVGGSD